MTLKIVRYRFNDGGCFEDVEAAMLLSIFATQSLYGEERVRLDTGHAMDAKVRSCVIDATSEVGRTLNRIFFGFVRREFSPEAFTVEGLDPAPLAATA